MLNNSRTIAVLVVAAVTAVSFVLGLYLFQDAYRMPWETAYTIATYIKAAGFAFMPFVLGTIISWFFFWD